MQGISDTWRSWHKAQDKGSWLLRIQSIQSSVHCCLTGSGGGLGALTSPPALLHKLECPGLDHCVEDVEVARVRALHRCIHQAAGMPRAKADSNLHRGKQQLVQQAASTDGPDHLQDVTKKYYRKSLFMGSIMAPHAVLTCRTWVMPYFLRTCRSLSAEMEPMNSPGLMKVGGSAFVFFSNESAVRGSGSSTSAQTGPVDASVSNCRLPRSIPVPTPSSISADAYRS